MCTTFMTLARRPHHPHCCTNPQAVMYAIHVVSSIAPVRSFLCFRLFPDAIFPPSMVMQILRTFRLYCVFCNVVLFSQNPVFFFFSFLSLFVIFMFSSLCISTRLGWEKFMCIYIIDWPSHRRSFAPVREVRCLSFALLSFPLLSCSYHLDSRSYPR